MKKMMLSVAVFLSFALMSCQKNNDVINDVFSLSARAGDGSRCKGKPILNCGCPDSIVPVCGCDGQTYENPCYAACAGVLSYTMGACDGDYGRSKK